MEKTKEAGANYMKPKTLMKKAYSDIFGKETGELLAGYADKMLKINEAGLNEDNLPKYTKLANKFNELLETVGGCAAIRAYNEQVMAEKKIRKKQYKNYIKPMEEKKRAEEAKQRREAEAVERFTALGIPQEWYAFSLDPDKVVRCDKERYVYYDYDNISSVHNDYQKQNVYEVMLDKLLMYKRRMEFVGKRSNLWIKDICVVNNEGEHFTCTNNGKFKFEHTMYGEELPEEWKRAGYKYSRYDQYMGTATYVKTVDASVFKELSVTVVVRLSDAERPEYGKEANQAELRYPIPEELREDILNYIRNDVRQLEIQGYELFDRIAAYFTEGRLMTDAKSIFNSSRK